VPVRNVQKPTLDEDGAERRNADSEEVDDGDRGAVWRLANTDDGRLGSPAADLSKRRFDKIEGYSSLGGLHKRVFDRIGDMSQLGGLSKKSSSDIAEDAEMRLPPPLPYQLQRQRMQRAFDRIGGVSSFGGLNKKAYSK